MKGFVKKLIGKLENRIKYNELCQKKFPNAKMSFTYKVQINAYKNVIEIVNQLAEEYNNGWIPCSERLPEKDMWCLATFESGNVDKIQYLVTNNWGWNGEVENNRVVAWKPLPEPYQKGE